MYSPLSLFALVALLSLANGLLIVPSMENTPIETFEYDSSDLCCKLDFVKTSFAFVLHKKVDVMSVNTSEGIWYVFQNGFSMDLSNDQTFISSPWWRVKWQNFLANPNGCQISWTSNYTEGLSGNSYIPTFQGYMLTRILYKVKPAYYDSTEDENDSDDSLIKLDDSSFLKSTTTTTKAPSQGVKSYAELYTFTGYSHKSDSDYSWRRQDLIRSVMYVECPTRPKYEKLIFSET